MRKELKVAAIKWVDKHVGFVIGTIFIVVILAAIALVAGIGTIVTNSFKNAEDHQAKIRQEFVQKNTLPVNLDPILVGYLPDGTKLYKVSIPTEKSLKYGSAEYNVDFYWEVNEGLLFEVK